MLYSMCLRNTFALWCLSIYRSFEKEPKLKLVGNP